MSKVIADFLVGAYPDCPDWLTATLGRLDEPRVARAARDLAVAIILEPPDGGEGVLQTISRRRLDSAEAEVKAEVAR